MPDPTRRTCQACGGHDSQVGPISWSGKCLTCAKTAVFENVEGLMDPGSPAAATAWPRWRVGMIRAAGGIVPERLLERAGGGLDNGPTIADSVG